jgi:S-(hydroxymethyl)glutathione dehydrogenase/alcohol dehydrogenase
MRFKAAILTELNKPLVLGELEVPELDVGQVLVRVRASGICGAQLGEISGAKGPDPWLPHLLGHEGGGIVMDIGPGVTTVKSGDHVVMHWRKGAGIEAKPPRYQWPADSGRRGYVGGGWVTTFNDHAVVSENRLTKVDQDFIDDFPDWAIKAGRPYEIMALMGCAVTTALGMVNNEAKVRIGESVVVAGCGGVGLNVIQAAILAGGNSVIGIDRSPAARSRALQAGATLTLGPDDNLEVEVRKLVGVKGADVFVDCTGCCDVIALGYDLVRPAGGRLILLGQPRHDECLTLPGMRRHYCGKTVLDSQGGLTDPTADIPRYLGLWRTGRLPVERFITHRFPLEQVNEALDVVRGGQAGRVILEMN